MNEPGRKLAIITGGAGGLGIVMAQRLIEDGFTTVMADRVDDAALNTAIETKLGGSPHAWGIHCDVTDPDSVSRMVDEVTARHGVIDALVTCAGIGPLVPVLDLSAEVWQQTLAVNLNGTFFCAQAVARKMAARRSGRIVTIASVSGARAGFGRTAYGVSKAGVIHLTRQLAVELAPYGITVNAVGPGPVDTELAIAHHTPEMRADYYRSIPMGRYGTPHEMADAVAFLCSDRCGYVTGQTLFVDGGFTAGGVDVASAQALGAEPIG